MKGHIEDVAASPNDPFFIVHHTMVDCLFEAWLERHPGGTYPLNPPAPGHGRNQYMVPFFPLATNGDMFQRAENLGYLCRLSNLIVGMQVVVRD